ncbi:unnamed protein product, partial [Staurois parvus]
FQVKNGTFLRTGELQYITLFGFTTFPPEDLPPILTRPLFVIRRCVTLTDNCAVMQCSTQMKFTSFFPTNAAFFQWYLIASAYFLCAIIK